jgi:hypothetical protein
MGGTRRNNDSFFAHYYYKKLYDELLYPHWVYFALFKKNRDYHIAHLEYTCVCVCVCVSVCLSVLAVDLSSIITVGTNQLLFIRNTKL